MTWVWTVAVAVPFAYAALLPALTLVDPFDRGAFAQPAPPDNLSISAYLCTAQANAGFGAFTAPAIAYVWLNPITRQNGSWAILCGSTLLTTGWLLLLLLPLDFASLAAHAAAVGIGLSGAVLLTAAMLLRVQQSALLYCWLALFLACSVLVAAFWNGPVVAFLTCEYIVLLLGLSTIPLFNTVGRVRTSPCSCVYVIQVEVQYPDTRACE